MADPSVGHSLVLAFDTPDPEFARGFEAGRIWAVLVDSPEKPFREMVHQSNAEMFLRMGEALNRSVRSEDRGDDWIEVTFEAAHDRVKA